MRNVLLLASLILVGCSGKQGSAPNTSADSSASPSALTPANSNTVRQPNPKGEPDTNPNPFISQVIFQNDEGEILAQDQYLALVSQKPGNHLDLEKLSQDVQSIHDAHPEFVSTTTQLSPSADKKQVVLTFEFLRERIVNSIQIKIPPEVKNTPRDLRQRLQTKLGTILRGQELSRDKETLRNAFIAMGYPKVAIQQEVNILDAQKGSVALLYHVNLGTAQAKVARLSLKGNTAYATEVLKAKLNFLNAPLFDANAMDLDIKNLKAFYIANGFADAAIAATSTTQADGATDIKISIQEGPLYRISQIQFEGNDHIETAILAKQLSFGAGSPYTGKDFRSSAQKLRELYGQNGYAFMDVKLDYDVKSGLVKFIISEGNIQHVDKVIVVGSTLNDPKTVLQYTALREGQTVNTKQIADSINALRATGIYSAVAVDFVPDPDPNKPDVGNISVAVTERASSSINFSFGYGTKTGYQGEISYSDQNVGGTGMGFSIDALKSQEETKLYALFREKYIFGTDLDFTGTAIYDQEKLPAYTKETSAARLMVEKQVNDNLNIGVGTRIEFVNISNAIAGMPPEVYQAEGKTHVVAGLVSKLVYEKEKVDGTGEAYGGYKIQMAFLPSYSDNEAYVKSTATILANQSIGQGVEGRRQVLTGRITIGYATDNIPFHEKFYVGGNSTLRGYEHLGPDGTLEGGSVMLSAGTYYSFPLFSDRFKGVAYVEAASVGNGFQDMGKVRVVGGLGVRADLSDTFLRSRLEAGFVFPAIQQAGDTVRPFYLLIGDYHPVYDL